MTVNIKIIIINKLYVYLYIYIMIRVDKYIPFNSLHVSYHINDHAQKIRFKYI